MNKESDALLEVEWMLLRMLEQAIEVAAVLGVVPTAEEALICAWTEVDRMIVRRKTIH